MKHKSILAQMHNRVTSQWVKLTLLMIFITVGGVSCINELPYEKPDDSNAKSRYITFNMNVPYVQKPATRSISESEERTISTIDVLVFKEDENQNELFSYLAPSRKRNDNVEGNQLQKFEAMVEISDINQRFVIITNASEEVNTLLQHNLKGAKKEDVLKMLTLSFEKEGDKWSAESESKFREFPMWGESGLEEIKSSTTTLKEGVTLYRMVSKIDVQININSSDPTEPFKLTNIFLYNTATSGRIVPSYDDADWTLGKDGTRKAVKNPTMPIGWSDSERYKGPLEYNLGDVDFTESGYKNGIYTFEMPTNSDQLKRPCLVIGGQYNGETDVTYYRVDFANRSESEPMSLLRNHQYIVSVIKVDGRGYESKEQAFGSAPMNIESGVLEWGDSKMGDVVFDGQNYLSVNKGVFELSRASYLTDSDEESLLIINTDYVYNEVVTDEKSGWRIVDISDKDGNPLKENWLSVADENKQGLPKEDGIVPLLVKENTETEPRTGYITIKAGRLEYVVEVVQSDQLQPKLTILKKKGDVWEEVNQIRFMQEKDKPTEESATYKIQWFPREMEVELYLGKGDGGKDPIRWKDGQSPIEDGSDNAIIASAEGEIEFTVSPEIIDNYVEGSFDERQDLLTVRMNYSGDVLMKILQLQQFVKDIVIDNRSVYVLNGREQHVTVRSNVMWEIEATKNISRGEGIGTPNVIVVEDWDKMEGKEGESPNSFRKGYYNLPHGDKAVFTTINDIADTPTVLMGNISLRAFSLEEGSDLECVREDILCASGIPQDNREANCYVLDPSSGAGLLIPVRAVNGIMIDKYREAEYGDAQMFIPEVEGGFGAPLGENTEYGAKLVWTDAVGPSERGIAEDGLLSKVMAVGKGVDGYILVMPGNPGKDEDQKLEGNAVIAATSDPSGTGNILWTWHIWVTKSFNFSDGVMDGRILGGHDSEEKDYFTGQKGNNAENWLDKNLGATSNNHEDSFNGIKGIASHGTNYQWGRKDPFPGANAASGDIVDRRPIYDENGKISLLFESLSSNTARPTPYETVIRNPLVIYSNHYISVGKEPWGVTGRGIDFEGKSILDPCPAGWRIPVQPATDDVEGDKKFWLDITSQTVHSEWWKPGMNGLEWGYGGNHHYKGGYYPAAGSSSRKTISSVGSIGNYWYANRRVDYEIQSYTMGFTKNGVRIHNAINRDVAVSVRCVRE